MTTGSLVLDALILLLGGAAFVFLLVAALMPVKEPKNHNDP